LKELNEEVLRHMEKRVYGGLKQEKVTAGKDQEGTLIVLEDERRANETRMQTYQHELARYEDRIKILASKPNYLDELMAETGQLQSKIRQVRR
jgi:DNA-binding transcriptional regulator YhcF (GntR family)